MLFFTSLFNKEGLPMSGWNINIILILFVAGLANTIIIFLTNYGFEKIQTIIASNILTLEMFFAVIFGFLFFKEIPNYKDVIGGLLILISVFQMNKLK
jgi:drug/metabolite transporter (DMT)-like permease